MSDYTREEWIAKFNGLREQFRALAESTPYGFARYGGQLKRAIHDGGFGALADAVAADSEPLF